MTGKIEHQHPINRNKSGAQHPMIGQTPLQHDLIARQPR